MKAKIIKKGLNGFTGDAWLIKINDDFYVVSGTYAMFSGWEVLVFPSDSEGNVTSWGEIAGGRGIPHEDAIQRLCKKLKGDKGDE